MTATQRARLTNRQDQMLDRLEEVLKEQAGLQRVNDQFSRQRKAQLGVVIHDLVRDGLKAGIERSRMDSLAGAEAVNISLGLRHDQGFPS